MLIARIAVPGLVLEAHQENRQFRLVILVAAGRSLPPTRTIETTAEAVEEDSGVHARPGLAKVRPLRLVRREVA